MNLPSLPINGKTSSCLVSYPASFSFFSIALDEERCPDPVLIDVSISTFFTLFIIHDGLYEFLKPFLRCI